MKNYIILLGLMLFLAQCQDSNKDANTSNAGNGLQAEALEVLQAGSYTYLRVDENGTEKWLAATKFDAEVGKTYYYKAGMEMVDFESKDLKRTFDQVYFLDGISDKPLSEATAADMHAAHGMTKSTEEMTEEHAGRHTPVATEVEVELADGGIRIGELFKNKAKYEGKTVKIKGLVTKFSPEIMEKNWVHLQDGTEFDGKFDLTITTLEEVKEGDTVVFEGTIALDKDLGFGYFYEVLMEESVVK